MKVLFLCPDYFDIYKVIATGIREILGYEVKLVVFTEYRYRNPFQKAVNFISKTFFGINLKKKWAHAERMALIKDDNDFDFVLMICPDFIPEKDLEIITKKGRRSIVYFWDSFRNIPAYERTLPYFDVKYSFEPEDVGKYGLRFLTNFYSEPKIATIDSDAFYIGTYDSRFPVIQKIVEALRSKNKHVKILLQTRKKRVIQKYGSAGITFLRERIPITEAESLSAGSKVILDIQKKIQHGLTFRVFEALGNHKKLITTNADIVNYDFYRPENIFIWTDETTEISDAFLHTEYVPIPNHIYLKYSLESWLKVVFEIT